MKKGRCKYQTCFFIYLINNLLYALVAQQGMTCIFSSELSVTMHTNKKRATTYIHRSTDRLRDGSKLFGQQQWCSTPAGSVFIFFSFSFISFFFFFKLHSKVTFQLYYFRQNEIHSQTRHLFPHQLYYYKDIIVISRYVIQLRAKSVGQTCPQCQEKNGATYKHKMNQ